MSLELRLFLAPALIGVASLLGRRFGPAVSGWLVGLPFTSGPIIFFLALDHGAAFAAAAATGTLAGAISEAVFCLAYAWMAFRLKWWLTAPAAILVFLAATFLLHVALSLLPFTPPPLPLAVVVGVALAVSLVLMRPLIEAGARMTGRAEEDKGEKARVPAWDLPARMIVAAVFVWALTGLAPLWGPQLAGLLAPFPLYVSILTIFAHQQNGPRAAALVLRGLLMGMFAFAGFFLALAVLLPSAGIAAAFITAILVALLLEAGAFWIIRRAW